MSFSILTLALLLVLIGSGVFAWRSAARTANRAYRRSETAVETAKLAIVTATTNQQPDWQTSNRDASARS